MALGSAIAIYFLFWFLALFLVLPFHARTDREMGVEPKPGHAESAPHVFPAGRVALRTTLLAAVFFALFLANYHCGWLDRHSLEWLLPAREEP